MIDVDFRRHKMVYLFFALILFNICKSECSDLSHRFLEDDPLSCFFDTESGTWGFSGSSQMGLDYDEFEGTVPDEFGNFKPKAYLSFETSQKIYKNSYGSVKLSKNGIVSIVSGVLIDSNHVLTSAHALSSVNPNKITFTSREEDVVVFESTAESWVIHPGFSDLEKGTSYDFSVISLKTPFFSKAVPFKSVEAFQEGIVKIIGFPSYVGGGEKGNTYNGKKMYEATGEVIPPTVSNICYHAETFPGMSGAPILDIRTGSILGVHIGKVQDVGYGVIITSEIEEWIRSITKSPKEEQVFRQNDGMPKRKKTVSEDE